MREKKESERRKRKGKQDIHKRIDKRTHRDKDRQTKWHRDIDRVRLV